MKFKFTDANNALPILFFALSVVFSTLSILFYTGSLSSSDPAVPQPTVKEGVSHSPNDIDNWFDSDALTQFHFFSGMEDGNSIRGWKISTVTHYFPIMPMFGLSYSLHKTPGGSILIFALIQNLFFILLFFYLAKSILSKYHFEASTVGVILYSLFFVSSIYFPENYTSANLLLPYHSGMALNSLLSLALLFNYIRTKKRLYLYSLSGIVALGSLSNPLYHVYFSVPVLVMLVFLAWRCGSPYWKLALHIVAGIAFGYILMLLLPKTNINMPSGGSTVSSYHMLVYTISNLYNSSVFLKVIIILSSVSFLYSFIVSINTITGLLSRKKTDPGRYNMYHVIFTGIFLLSVFAPLLKGNFLGPWCIRYILYAIAFSLFNIGIILIKFVEFRNFRYAYSVSAIAIIIGCLWIFSRSAKQNPLQTFPRYINYNNSLAVAVDSLASLYPLKNGISEFWAAKPITVFSKKGVKVLHVYSSAVIWHHSAYLGDFYFNTDGSKSIFNFVVLHNWGDTSILDNFFGDSIQRVSISGYDFYLVPDFYYGEYGNIQLIEHESQLY
jgi:hypothetical protein